MYTLASTPVRFTRTILVPLKIVIPETLGAEPQDSGTAPVLVKVIVGDSWASAEPTAVAPASTTRPPTTRNRPRRRRVVRRIATTTLPKSTHELRGQRRACIASYGPTGMSVPRRRLNGMRIGAHVDSADPLAAATVRDAEVIK